MEDTYKGMIFVAVFIFIIFGFSLVDAKLPGYVSSGDCVNIKIPLNATWVNISSITYPNQTMISLNVATSKIGSNFFYNSFCDTSQYGFYSYEFFDDTSYSSGNSFEVTKYGISNSIWLIIMFSTFIVSIIGIMFYINASKKYSLEKSESKLSSMFENGSPVKSTILSFVHSFMEHYMPWVIVLGIIPVWCIYEIVSISGMQDMANIGFVIFNGYFVLVLFSTLYWFDCVFKLIKRIKEQVEDVSRGIY